MESTDIERRGGGGGGGGGGEEGEKHLRMVYYYYINYKQFVNVVKYKLDRMRKAIEAEEKKVQAGAVLCWECGGGGGALCNDSTLLFGFPTITDVSTSYMSQVHSHNHPLLLSLHPLHLSHFPPSPLSLHVYVH